MVPHESDTARFGNVLRPLPHCVVFIWCTCQVQASQSHALAVTVKPVCIAADSVRSTLGPHPFEIELLLPALQHMVALDASCH